MLTDVSEVRAASIYFGLPTHLPLARFLPYRHSFPIGQPIPLDSYITSDPFVLGSLIALMMEAARTSETSVDIQLRTLQYIPEDSELHTRCCENLKSHIERELVIQYILDLSNPAFRGLTWV
jgi:hypothetical protein